MITAVSIVIFDVFNAEVVMLKYCIERLHHQLFYPFHANYCEEIPIKSKKRYASQGKIYATICHFNLFLEKPWKRVKLIGKITVYYITDKLEPLTTSVNFHALTAWSKFWSTVFNAGLAPDAHFKRCSILDCSCAYLSTRLGIPCSTWLIAWHLWILIINMKKTCAIGVANYDREDSFSITTQWSYEFNMENKHAKST